MLELEPLHTGTVTDEETLRVFLDRLEQQLEEVVTSLGHLSYQKYRDKRAPEGLDKVEQVRAGLMRNQAYHEVVQRFQGTVTDALVARRLEVWDRLFRAARVSELPDVVRLKNRISNRIVGFTFRVQGEEVGLGRLRQILRTERDREQRRAAWMASSPLAAELGPMTRELVDLRNAAAGAAGYRSYAHMSLDFAGLDLERTVAILNELQAASENSYRTVLAEGAARAGIADVQPWDLKFILEGEYGPPASKLPVEWIQPRLAEWGRLHGIPLDDRGIAVHYLDIPFNGLCMPIASGDIRILGNVNSGLTYYKTMFHELGHALHASFSDPGAYVLRREPAVFNEGMAETMAYVVFDPEWLAHIGLPHDQVQAAVRGKLGTWFAYLRERSAWALFEYGLYANPGQNLDRLLADVESRMLGCAMDTTQRWAANAWYSGYPIYWQNYVLGDVIASQIHHDLRRRFGKGMWRSEESVRYVCEHYWAPGGLVEWQTKIERGTGEPLSTKALVADLSVS